MRLYTVYKVYKYGDGNEKDIIISTDDLFEAILAAQRYVEFAMIGQCDDETVKVILADENKRVADHDFQDCKCVKYCYGKLKWVDVEIYAYEFE